MNTEKAWLGRIMGWGIVLVPLLYVSTCSLISGKVSRGFDLVKEGDSESQVLRVLGSPSVREKAGGRPFHRYASKPCVSPCAERLWFENRLAPGFEAWSFELDASHKVIRKSTWLSP